ncbi:MAG: adenine-specific methyltransferase EcoRI family protein [Nitrosopumilus sp.]|nr:adenine-specific methyltransferase EcoRI family protein [Nitrosopumilus sp.]
MHLGSDDDFKNDECIEISKQCDIIVTNPPFSLFREYVAQLIKFNKQFLS